MKIKAVLYARVSGDDRRNESRNLKGQLDMGREYALQRGYEIIEELAEDDRGASGASFELPELSKVREMAQARSFEVLIVREIDRLSRSLAKQLVVEEELERMGVRVEYVLGEYDDTPEGRLNKHIRATIAEYEREKISERMRRGRRLKVMAGSVLVANRPPYGYRVKQKNGKYYLEVFEPEAKIIRLIYDWFLKGDETGERLSLRKIARKLTAMGIALPQNGVMKSNRGLWVKTTIHKILHMETYAGVWTYGKNNRGRPNPSDKLIKVNVPAIVERETWKAAQVRLLETKMKAARNIKFEYLIRGRIRCAKCNSYVRWEGQRQGKKVYKYYVCSARKSHDCDCLNGNADKIDGKVWEWVKALFLDRTSLEEGLRDYLEQSEENEAPTLNRISIIDDLIKQKTQKLDRLLELYLTEEFTKEILLDHKKRLQTEIDSLEAERIKLESHLEVRTLNKTQISNIHEFAGQVREGLVNSDEDFKTRHNLIELLDVQARWMGGIDEQYLDVQCILGAKTLSFTDTSTCAHFLYKNLRPTLPCREAVGRGRARRPRG